MSIRNTIEKVRNSFSSNRSNSDIHSEDIASDWGVPQEEVVLNNDVNNVVGSKSYQQWYEKDAERWEIEKKEMENRGFKPGIMHNGCVCFLKKAASSKEFDTAVICDWLYPLKPPSLFLENIPDNLQLPKNDDGSIDVFSKSMAWEPGMAAITVVDYLDEKLELVHALSELKLNECADKPVPMNLRGDE